MDLFVGDILLIAGRNLPRYYLPCDGRLMPRNQTAYSGLFSLIGNCYGGDGITTFALPLIPNPFGSRGGLGYCICVAGIYPTRP
jgi:microcystin-dependent protein